MTRLEHPRAPALPNERQRPSEFHSGLDGETSNRQNRYTEEGDGDHEHQLSICWYTFVIMPRTPTLAAEAATEIAGIIRAIDAKRNQRPSDVTVIKVSA